MSKIFGAIDLGASSGRVIAAVIGDGELTITELHRFANTPVPDGQKLFWDYAGLQREIAVGLRKLGEFAAAAGTTVTSIGIDTWAVDYGLLDADGNLVANTRNYRDERNAFGVAIVDKAISPADQYRHNGLQFLQFNTLYQLAAHQVLDADEWDRAATMLLIPDLIAYWLTGIQRTERTNASTTGLLNVATHEWDWDLIDLLGFKRELFTELVSPGQVIGGLLPEHISHPALANAVVTAVPSHDTAAAVVGTPLADSHSAYLSSGTWSLLGLELDEPVISARAQQQNFTNELGAENRIRFLKNLSGLWLLQQCLATWQQQDSQVDLLSLLAEGKGIQSDSRLDVTDEEFLAPGDMPARIQTHCARRGSTVPRSRAEIVRCILDSLADAYASSVSGFEEVTGTKIERINVVGGGSQNALLAQLTANTTGIEVLTGPVEATALGNLITQAGAHGCAPSSLAGQRKVIADHFAPISFQPENQKFQL